MLSRKNVLELCLLQLTDESENCRLRCHSLAESRTQECPPFCRSSSPVLQGALAIPGVHRSTPAGIEYKLTTVTPYPRVPISESVTCHVSSASIGVSNHNAPIITILCYLHLVRAPKQKFQLEYLTLQEDGRVETLQIYVNNN